MEVPAFASRLDKEHGILIRAGLHCAPEVHKLLGSDSTGAIRLSLGWCTTESDVDRAIEAVARVAGAGKVFKAAVGARPS
jgi:selenocysteine lyase/cysteine desulfurase